MQLRSVAFAIAAAAAGCGRLHFDLEPTASDASAADAAPDGPSGAWTVVSSQPGAPATSSSAPITSTAQVAAGDLVVPMCRGSLGSMPADTTYTITPSGLVTLPPVITRWDPVSQYWNAFTWGVIGPAAGANTTLTVTSSSFQGPSDCGIDVLRGGIAAPSLIAAMSTIGGAGGFVTCGPVPTVAGGAALYSAGRTTCADAPMSGPFMQLGTSFGNPWGGWAPTDGTTASATLDDCGNSGGWICTVIALTP